MRRALHIILFLFVSGVVSANIPRVGREATNLAYDDCHRLTSLTRPALPQGPITTSSYDAVGNLTTDGETGTGTYNYGGAGNGQLHAFLLERRRDFLANEAFFWR